MTGCNAVILAVVCRACGNSKGKPTASLDKLIDVQVRDAMTHDDFCRGPVNNGGEPDSRDARRTGFYWTPQQRDRLARLVDLSLITHRHHDHDAISGKRVAERTTSFEWEFHTRESRLCLLQR